MLLFMSILMVLFFGQFSVSKNKKRGGDILFQIVKVRGQLSSIISDPHAASFPIRDP